jgi:hypothetical protein
MMPKLGVLDVFDNNPLALDYYSRTMQRVLNEMGYYPILGSYVGYCRRKLVNEKLEQFPEERTFYNTHKVRSYLELMSCGCVFIVPDFLITIGRLFYRCITKPPSSPPEQIP